jgi:hypothetical protein
MRAVRANALSQLAKTALFASVNRSNVRAKRETLRQPANAAGKDRALCQRQPK